MKQSESRDYGRSRLKLRLKVIDLTSAAGLLSLTVVEGRIGVGVGLCESDARSSLLDFSRSKRCLLNFPIPGR